jgi:hypothetical protein
MRKTSVLITVSLLMLLGPGAIVPSLAQPLPRIQESETTQNVLFRTKNYVAQIIWRRGIPYMSVSNNGWRVLSDVRATVLPQRGVADSWTTYVGVSGDYLAYVRVRPPGEAAIAVTLAGRRVTEEYAQAPAPKRSIRATTTPENTIFALETLEYAVRVFQQQNGLFMNLYNKKTETVDLKRVPVTLVNTSDAKIYRHDGNSTIQAREDVRGRRSLVIIRDNAIQYRGEAF